MTKTCDNCKNFNDKDHPKGSAWGLCTFVPPATIAKALGISDQYEIQFADTHCEWSCGLWAAEE